LKFSSNDPDCATHCNRCGGISACRGVCIETRPPFSGVPMTSQPKTGAVHQANAALSGSDQQFRLLVQGVKDYAIFILDPQGRIATWNSGAEHIKRYRAEEIIGEHFSRFYTEEDRREGMPMRLLSRAGKEGRHEAEGWRVRKDGSRFRASVVIDAIYDDA